MARRSVGNRAAFGGFATVMGLILSFSDGYMKPAGVVLLIIGLISLFFAFYRMR